MPDLFVANDDNDVVTHKRVPLPNQETSPNEEDIVVVAKPQTLPFSPEPAVAADKYPFFKKIEFHKNQKDNQIPLFTAFWQNPKGVRFDTQDVDEHILLFLRRHPVTNFSWIVTSLFFILIPFSGMYIAGILNKPFIFLSFPFTVALVLLYLLIVITNAFASFLNWYYNISLITEKRIVDIELINLIGEKISATKIALVQDINYHQAGTVRSVFNYGDVLIQTAGTIDNFLIQAAPRPEAVVRILENLIGEDGRHVGR